MMFVSPYFWERDATFYGRENKYRLLKDGKAHFIKIHMRRRTPLVAVEEGQIDSSKGTKKRRVNLRADGMVDLEKQVEATCFYLLHRPDFGEQKPQIGEL